MRSVTSVVIATIMLAGLAVSAQGAVDSTECTGGTDAETTRMQVTIEAEHCPPQPKHTPTWTPTPEGTPSGGNGNGNSNSNSNAGSDEPSSPPRQTVSRERWAELLDQCKRGPNNDDLSPQCAANLPDIAGDPNPATPGAPTGPGAPRVTVAQVRESAIDQINMGAPEVGASPCVSAADACRGTVGVPVWLWVSDGNGSLPSESATASAGPFTINAAAKVSKVKWSLGDGQTTVCAGTGTAYDAQRDGWSSPACGFDSGWKKSGTYTLTATYVWDISWTGDDAGSATQSLSSSEQVTVGELQSVASKG